ARAYRTVREGSVVSRVRSFWVMRPPCSRTLKTSFAEGGRCAIRSCTVFSSVSFATKTIPHSMDHHNSVGIHNC
ncbi:MAG: hypothetical protein ABFC24_08355, partial [Methanoregulaceae archaeon]